ncbi:hypothetical protein Acor_54980 [Acrocarpospora corrugata]|uniref:Uncharacterized protein n=1 Tax=Acrocarpospora corrugata TaxID=35763 RepID=A0A5M3W5X3_9ACTN|nr:hypothetical protein [Acrocarpospora corrugata]GES03432.1 hypothetical protein Acor_54980 [Acrocarpospora corrugata]
MTAETVGNPLPETEAGPLARVRSTLRAQKVLSFYREDQDDLSPDTGSRGDLDGDDVGRRLVVVHPRGGKPATIGWASSLGAYLLSVPRSDGGADSLTTRTEQETVEALARLWEGTAVGQPVTAADRLRELRLLLEARGIATKILKADVEARLEVEAPGIAVTVTVGGRGMAYLVCIGSGREAPMLMAGEAGEAAGFVVRGINRGPDASPD